MGNLSRHLRREHADLRRELSDALRLAVSEASPERALEAARVVQDVLLPHARAEEESLYAAADRVYRRVERPTELLRVDHDHIQAHAALLEEAAREVRVAGPATHAEMEARLARLASVLEALVRTHLEKEERILLPLLDAHLSPEEAREVDRQFRAAEGPMPSA